MKSKDPMLLSFLHPSQWKGSEKGGTSAPQSVIPVVLSQKGMVLVMSWVIQVEDRK